jgi:hypothetical protein
VSYLSDLFQAFAGRAPAAIFVRLTEAASVMRRRLPAERRREIQAPPIFLSDKHLRRDIGLPPLDDRGWPL